MKFTIIATALIASLPLALALNCRGSYTYTCDNGCGTIGLQHCNPKLPCNPGQTSKTTHINGPYQQFAKCNWLETFTYQCCTK